MEWVPITRPRSKPACEHREQLLDLLGEEIRHGNDGLATLYAGLLVDALETLAARHRARARPRDAD
jgi:hypothetical protein